MNTHQWSQHQQSQRRRCREAREEWEEMYQPAYQSDLHILERSSILPLRDRVANLEEQMFLSPNGKLWDTIQQQNAKINYLGNKLNAILSSKEKKYETYE